MFLCLHTHLLLCSAQHCPPAPSCLPTLVPPGQRFHRTLTVTMMPPLLLLLLLLIVSISHLWPWMTKHLPSTFCSPLSFPSHVPNLWMTSLPKPGLLWHCKEPHGPVDYQAEAGYGTVPGALAVCRRYLADVQQCLVVQPQDIQSLQVLLQISWSVWVRDWSGHARPRILLREKGKESI